MLARSPDAAVRAAALIRLARVLRKRGDIVGAVRAYDMLFELRQTRVGGEPAELIARQGRARIFEETGAAQQLQQEAAGLARVLCSGALPIDRVTFEFYWDLLRKWGVAPPSASFLSRTDAAIELWRSWHSGELAQRGRRLISAQPQPILAVWED